MGTTSEKLTYLAGTKTELKEAINNLGGNIDNTTTFREYAQELDNIYDNIPKTTGEDTNLSLTTLKGKMNIIPKNPNIIFPFLEYYLQKTCQRHFVRLSF